MSVFIHVFFFFSLAFGLIDGQVDPMLFSLVRKDLSQQGPRHMVLIGDKMVDYNEKFRLFFSTRNPHVRGAPTCSPHALRSVSSRSRARQSMPTLCSLFGRLHFATSASYPAPDRLHFAISAAYPAPLRVLHRG